MTITTVQNSWNSQRVISIPVDYVMPSVPVPGYPHGRKALYMSEWWQQRRLMGDPGVLWVDPDVAADPDDLAAMAAAIGQLPADMHTGMVKLWPQSTQRDTWIWSHRPGTLGSPAATQDDNAPVMYVSTCFLYTPARLLRLAFPRHASWQWIEVDVGLSELAIEHGIAAHAVQGCRPKHLHFTPDHEWSGAT